MERQWYIIGDGRQQIGPVPEAELSSYGIKPSTLVWTAGMPEWRRASECPPLVSLIAAESARHGESINLRKPEDEADFRQVIDVEIDDEPRQAPRGEGRRIPDPNNPGHWQQPSPDAHPGPGGQPSYGYENPNVGNPRNGHPYGEPLYRDNMYGGGGYDAGSGKSNIVAGLLAIFLGWLGIQYFYIGKVGGGLLTILLTLVSCGLWSIITLIQGIYMITLPQSEFDRKYVYNGASFPLF